MHFELPFNFSRLCRPSFPIFHDREIGIILVTSWQKYPVCSSVLSPVSQLNHSDHSWVVHWGVYWILLIDFYISLFYVIFSILCDSQAWFDLFIFKWSIFIFFVDLIFGLEIVNWLHMGYLVFSLGFLYRVSLFWMC